VADGIATEKVAYNKPAITSVGSLVELTAAATNDGYHFDGAGYEGTATGGS
jgi:hypothetical protein